jgi:hypothetical protein
LLLAHRFGRNCGIRAELETDRSRESEKHRENIFVSQSRIGTKWNAGILEYWNSGYQIHFFIAPVFQQRQQPVKEVNQ